MIIESPCNSINIANIRKLILVDIDEVILIPEPDDNWTIPVDGILYKQGVTQIEVKFGFRKASFQEDMQRTVNGVSYMQRIEATIPLDCPQVVTGVNFLQNRRFIALIKDGNRRVRVAGTKKQPLRITGNALTIGENSRTISLSCEVKQQGSFYGILGQEALIGRFFNSHFTLNFI